MLNDSKHTFAIYTDERTKQRWPIRVAAATELEMYDWVCMLACVCITDTESIGRMKPEVWCENGNRACQRKSPN